MSTDNLLNKLEKVLHDNNGTGIKNDDIIWEETKNNDNNNDNNISNILCNDSMKSLECKRIKTLMEILVILDKSDKDTRVKIFKELWKAYTDSEQNPHFSVNKDFVHLRTKYFDKSRESNDDSDSNIREYFRYNIDQTPSTQYDHAFPRSPSLLIRDNSKGIQRPIIDAIDINSNNEIDSKNDDSKTEIRKYETAFDRHYRGRHESHLTNNFENIYIKIDEIDGKKINQNDVVLFQQELDKIYCFIYHPLSKSRNVDVYPRAQHTGGDDSHQWILGVYKKWLSGESIDKLYEPMRKQFKGSWLC